MADRFGRCEGPILSSACPTAARPARLAPYLSLMTVNLIGPEFMGSDAVGPDSVAEWLPLAASDHRLHASQHPAEPNRPRDALAAIALAAAYLEQQFELTPPPLALRQFLEPWLARVPQQTFGLDARDVDALAWLDFAAAAELLGDNALARLVIDSVARCVSEDTALTALCAFRRGRVARRDGHLEDARWHYEDAIRLSRALPSSDAAPLAYSGLANVFIDAGDFARAAAVLRRALQPERAYHRLHRFILWQGLALVRRKQGKLASAMESIWHAYDLAVHEPGLRAEALISLSELAVEMGAADTALRGVAAALTTRCSERALVAAYVVQLRARIALHDAGAGADAAIVDGTDARATARQLSDLLASITAPQEIALALLWLSETDLRTGQLDAARRRVTRAVAVAQEHGFAEYLSHGERVLAEVQARTQAQDAHTPFAVARPVPRLLDAAASRLSPLIRLHLEAHV